MTRFRCFTLNVGLELKKFIRDKSVAGDGSCDLRWRL